MTDDQEIVANGVSTGRLCIEQGGRTTDLHCNACALELILTSVAQDVTTGFERHSFACPACNARLDRIVFIRNGREDDPELMPIYHVAPSVAPASTAQEEHDAAPGIFGRFMARLCGTKY